MILFLKIIGHRKGHPFRKFGIKTQNLKNKNLILVKISNYCLFYPLEGTNYEYQIRQTIQIQGRHHL